MRFNEQASDTHRHTRTRQLGNLSTTAAACCAKRVAALQRVGYVKDNRRIVGRFFHHAKAQHIHNQVVITEVSTTVAQDNLVVTAFDKLVDDITHLARAHELWFLHVNNRAGFRHRFNQVSLTREERWQLDNVNHVSNRLRLACLVNVGDDFHTEGLLQLLENLHPFFQARTTVRVNG